MGWLNRQVKKKCASKRCSNRCWRDSFRFWEGCQPTKKSVLFITLFVKDLSRRRIAAQVFVSARGHYWFLQDALLLRVNWLVKRSLANAFDYNFDGNAERNTEKTGEALQR